MKSYDDKITDSSEFCYSFKDGLGAVGELLLPPVAGRVVRPPCQAREPECPRSG